MILVIVVVVVCQCCRLRRHRLIVESVAASLLLAIYAHNLTKCDEFVISHYVLFFFLLPVTIFSPTNVHSTLYFDISLLLSL